MTLLVLTPRQGNNYHPHDGTPSESQRELTALKGTAIDAERFPIIAAHWPSALIVGGKLVCHDFSPLVRRFKTSPVVQIEEPSGIDDRQHVDDVADRVLAVIAAKTKDEAA